MNIYMHTSDRKHDYIRIHTNIYVVSYTTILSYIYMNTQYFEFNFRKEYIYIKNNPQNYYF